MVSICVIPAVEHDKEKADVCTHHLKLTASGHSKRTDYPQRWQIDVLEQ